VAHPTGEADAPGTAPPTATDPAADLAAGEAKRPGKRPAAKSRPGGAVSLEVHAYDFWLARLAVAAIAALQFGFINESVILGPRWLAPGAELAILIPLSLATAMTHAEKRRPKGERRWWRRRRARRTAQRLALFLTALCMLINLLNLAAVTHALLEGARGPTGKSLLIDALNIWVTNIVIFALWYWNIDRGGAIARSSRKTPKPDFLFPQMLGTGDRNPTWSPGFVDYIYVSFTNATAFSPTDTMPLSRRAKGLMMIQAAASLLTVGLVAARAVNILG
jgi:hypothetical protein